MYFFLLLTFSLIIPLHGHAQSTGVVQGQVVDASDGSPLPGANVVVEGMRLGASTNENGEYELQEVPAGSQTLVVSFVGYEQTSVSIEVNAGETNVVDVKLPSKVTEAGEVVVSGIRRSQLRSVNEKRRSLNVVDVISADDIGNLPEKNVAEAIQRLPGIVMRNDRTEGRFVSIRGSAANLNNVTLNGNTLASTAGSRATALDLLPAEMVSNIEVTKAVRPDQDGNAVGGSVDINTLSAFDRNKPFAFGSFRGLNHDQQVSGLRETNTPFRANLTAGTQLGSDDEFGVVVSGSASRRDFTTSALKGEDWENAEERGAPAGVSVPEAQEQIVETHLRRRFAINSSLDWRPTNQTSVFARPYWTYTDEESLANELELNFLGEATAAGRNRVRFSEGFAELDLSSSSEEETLWGGSAGFEHEFNNGFTWEASGTFTRGTLDMSKPDGEFNTPVTEQVSSVVDMSDFLFEAFPENPTFVGNADNFTQNDIDVEFQENEEDTWSAKTDLRVPFGVDEYSGFLKTGGKVLLRDKSVNAAELEFIADPEQAPTMQRFVAPSVQTVQVGNRLFPFADTDAFVDWFNNEGCSPRGGRFSGDRSCEIDGPFDINEREVAVEDIENDSENEEDIYAGYLMGSAQIGRLTVLAGARVERTTTDTRRFQLLEEEETDEFSTTTQDFSTSYTDVLPSVHLTYEVLEDLQLRAAWTNTIGRPDFEELAAFREVSVSPPQPDGRFTASVEEGNPNLDPFEATTIDFGGSYFFDSGGMFSTAGFYKQIDNPIFTFQRTERNVQDAFGQGREFEEINFSQERNADDGHVLGLEVTYQQPFTFLPSPFDGFGVSSNVTVTDSEVDVPSRDGDLPFFEQADLTYNVIPYFQKQGFTFRVALNHRGEFLDELDDVPEEDVFAEGRTTVDLNTSYEFTGIPGTPELLFQIENATNAPEVFTNGQTGDNLSFHFLSGRTISVGFKTGF